MKYDPHKSSLFDLDANIAALLIYLLPWLISMISNTLGSLAWLIPLFAFIMESKSDFVHLHAATSLAFFSIEAVIHFVSISLGITAFLTSWMDNFFFLGALYAGVRGIIILVFAILLAIISLYLLIGRIVALIRAYQYSDVHIPLISQIAYYIMKLKH